MPHLTTTPLLRRQVEHSSVAEWSSLDGPRQAAKHLKQTLFEHLDAHAEATHSKAIVAANKEAGSGASGVDRVL